MGMPAKPTWSEYPVEGLSHRRRDCAGTGDDEGGEVQADLKTQGSTYVST